MPRRERSPAWSIASRVTREITAFGPLVCTVALIAGLLHEYYLLAAFFAIIAVDWCDYVRPERMIGVYSLLALGVALNDKYTYAALALGLVAYSVCKAMIRFS